MYYTLSMFACDIQHGNLLAYLELGVQSILRVRLFALVYFTCAFV